MTLVGEDTNQILADNTNCDMIIYVDDFVNNPKDMGRHHSNCVTYAKRSDLLFCWW